MQHDKHIDSLITIFICVDYYGTNTCSLVGKIVIVYMLMMMSFENHYKSLEIVRKGNVYEETTWVPT